MLTAKEWFEEELSGEPLTQESVIEVLEMVQKEAWNEALDKAAENVNYIKESYIDKDNLWDYKYTTEIDKQSILKLKL